MHLIRNRYIADDFFCRFQCAYYASLSCPIPHFSRYYYFLYCVYFPFFFALSSSSEGYRSITYKKLNINRLFLVPFFFCSSSSFNSYFLLWLSINININMGVARCSSISILYGDLIAMNRESSSCNKCDFDWQRFCFVSQSTTALSLSLQVTLLQLFLVSSKGSEYNNVTFL